MAGKGDALVVIGCDSSAVKKAASEAVSAWKDVGRSISTEMGNATQSIINDLGRIVTAQGAVNFSQQHQQVREFEASTARMAVATNRDLESVRRAAEANGIELGKRPAEVVAWSTEVGRLTGRYSDAEKSMRGFVGLAAATNRSVDDYRSLAVELANVGHVSGDSTHALGVMTAQAQMLGTVGGPAAFADQIASLQSVISHFGVTSEADFLRVTAAAGALGKGLNPEAAARVQQGVLGFLSSNTWQHERYLGHRITDDHGQIRTDVAYKGVKGPMAFILEERDKVMKQYGAQRARPMLSMMFGGMENAAAVMNMNPADLIAAQNAKPSKTNEEAVKRYLGTDAGKRDVAGAELAKASRDLLGSSTALGRAADALQKFAGNHPIASTVASTAAGGIIGATAAAVGKTVTLGIRAAGAGGLPALGKGALALGGVTLAGITTLVGAGLAGAYGIHKFDLAEQEREKLNARAADVSAQSALEQRRIAMKRANAAAHGVAGLSPAERGAAINATTEVVQHAKDSMTALQLSHGGGGAIQALAAALRAQKNGLDDASIDKLARGIASAMQGVPLHVTTDGETPITVTKKAAHHSSAGHQGHQ